MNTTLLFILGMLLLSLAAPFVSLYAISLIKKRKYDRHLKIQNFIFGICVGAVLIFELYIRFSGGSGSLITANSYTQTSFFRTVLIAHIVGAVLTYCIWTVMIVLSNRKYKKRKGLPGMFSLNHKRLGYVTIGGLFYTVISAFAVCLMAFFL